MKRTTTQVIKSVELPNRVRLPYVEQGDSSGVPVLLLHAIAELLALLRAHAASPA